MSILKYPSMKNDFAALKSKEIVRNMNKNWYSSEKIEGTNVNVNINKDNEVELGSRSKNLDDNENINYYQPFIDYMNEHDELITILRNMKKDFNCKEIHLYGELFGHNVQQTNYDVNKQHTTDIIFFTVMIEKDCKSIVLSRIEIEPYLKNYLIPIVEINKLDKFINRNIDEHKGQYGNHFEGYIYANYDFRYEFGKHSPFLSIKHKTTEHQEVIPQSKSYKLKNKQLFLNKDMNRYVTENRLKHVLQHLELNELNKDNFNQVFEEMKNDIYNEYTNENDTSSYISIQLKMAIDYQDQYIKTLLKNKLKGDY